jgi:hypothetical protein
MLELYLQRLINMYDLSFRAISHHSEQNLPSAKPLLDFLCVKEHVSEALPPFLVLLIEGCC